MPTHGNLMVSSHWQSAELARRMLGERPSPVPPTRDLWPPPQEQLSISTLHLAYQQDCHEDWFPKRASTLSLQPYAPTTVPIDDAGPRTCTVGTNTEPPITFVKRMRRLFKRNRNESTPHIKPSTIQLRPASNELVTDLDEDFDSPGRRTFTGIKKVIAGAKYRIAPSAEVVESPRIVYNLPKPGDRMLSAFGKRERRRCFNLPSRTTIIRRVQSLRSVCRRPPRSPAHQHPQSLQITQV